MTPSAWTDPLVLAWAAFAAVALPMVAVLGAIGARGIWDLAWEVFGPGGAQ